MFDLEDVLPDDATADELLGLGGAEARAPGDPDALFPRGDSLLAVARQAHGGLADYRRQRAFIRQQLASMQWGTYTDPETGIEVDEEEDLRDQGLMPWSNNRLRPLMRHIKGQMRQNASERTPFAVEDADQQTVSAVAEALRSERRRERSRMLDADGIAELAASGMYVRKAEETWDDELDRYVIDDDPVPSYRFFFDVQGATDRRLKGVSLMGEIVDAHPDEVLAAFAETPEHEAAIREIYGIRASDLGLDAGGTDPFDDGFGEQLYDARMGDMAGWDRADAFGFDVPPVQGRCRVVVVWRKEAGWNTWYYDPAAGARFTAAELAEMLTAEGVPTTEAEAVAEVDAENATRQLTGAPPIEAERRYDRFWVVYYVAPSGHVLSRRVDPYDHRKTPYTVFLFDFADGEVRGFFDDLVDVQKQINRSFAQIDAMTSAQIHGFWAIPEQVLPEGMDKEEFVDEMHRVGNVLFYDLDALKGRQDAAQLIKHVQSVGVPVASVNHLQLLGDAFEQMSGFSGAIAGQEPPSGTPASLHAQVIAQGSTQMLDLFETFFEGLVEHDERMLALIIQFWDDVVPLRASASADLQTYRPEDARALSWYVSMGRTSETALYRQLFEEDLKEFLTARYLTFPQYLRESSHPRAQALLQLVETTNPLLSGAAGPDQLVQLAAMAEAGDPEAITLLQQAQEWQGGPPMPAA